MEGDDDLVWKPEEGDEEQGAIADWIVDATKLCLLTLACLAGRVSLELKEELMDRMPSHQWASISEMTAHMEGAALHKLVAESEPPPFQQGHYLTPPNINGRSLAANAVVAIVKAIGHRTLACTVSQRCHQSKTPARQIWSI